MSFFEFFEENLKISSREDFNHICDDILQNPYVFENKEKTFNLLPSLNGHLGDFAFRTLANNPRKVFLIDHTSGRKAFNGATLLALSIAFSKFLKKHVEDKRVGIALPAGIGSHVANIALLMLNKTPINLNFTLGKGSVESAIQQSQIFTIITTQAIQDKFPKFPWTENIIDIAKVIKKLSKLKLIGWMLSSFICPTDFLAKRLHVPSLGGEKEASILFSSGTTGTPKGIVLSHKNIIANCLQISHLCLVKETDSALACLPIFHSFGMTVLMWYTLLAKKRVSSYISPLDAKKLGEIIEQDKLTIAVSTPTFFRQYFKNCSPEQLKTLRLSAAGAERVPFELIRNWKKMYNSELIAAYGLTEASPVVSANLPHEEGEINNCKIGSVGRILPGISVKFIGPETGRDLPLGESGILCLRGANIFSGYLNDIEKTQQSFKDGWFITGDVARLDLEGFLHIEGRISRFSKIGGEMVPHIGIEEAISELFDLKYESDLDLAIMSRIDTKKGESLVLLTRVDIDMAVLREKFTANGYSNLWLPRDIIKIEEIPCLATGKINLAACKMIIDEHFR